MTTLIRRVAPHDVATITEMIHALAEFEHAADQCTVTETQISAALFEEPTTVYGHVAEVDGEVAAMALWFVNFSTWDGVGASIWKTCSCARDFAGAGWPGRCWRRWPANACSGATPGCPGRC